MSEKWMNNKRFVLNFTYDSTAKTPIKTPFLEGNPSFNVELTSMSYKSGE